MEFPWKAGAGKRWHQRLLGAAVTAVVLLATACGGAGGPSTQGGSGSGSLLASLRESGSIRVGIANEVPFGYEDANGNVTGEAPEVARVVLERMGITDMEAVVVDFGALIPSLQAGQFDMIAAGMAITPERSEQILFSDPDHCVSTALAVSKGNPRGITDLQSIIGTSSSVAVLSGSVSETWVTDLRIPDGQIQRFADDLARYDALRAGRVDTVIGTSLAVTTQVNATPEAIEGTRPFFPVVNGEEQVLCGGFGFRDPELRDAFNAELQRAKQDGTTMPIITRFGFSPADVEKAADLTAAELTAK